MVTNLDRSKKNRTEFRIKDGRRPIFPDDWKRDVTMLENDSINGSVLREVRNAVSIPDKRSVGRRCNIVADCSLLCMCLNGVTDFAGCCTFA